MLRAEVPVADLLVFIAATDDSGLSYNEELWQARNRMLKAVQDALAEETD